MATADGRSPLLVGTRLIVIPQGSKMFQFPWFGWAKAGLPVHPNWGTRTACAVYPGGQVVVSLSRDIHGGVAPAQFSLASAW